MLEGLKIHSFILFFLGCCCGAPVGASFIYFYIYPNNIGLRTGGGSPTNILKIVDELTKEGNLPISAGTPSATILEGNKYQARPIIIDLIQSKIVEEDLRTQYGGDKNARLGTFIAG